MYDAKINIQFECLHVRRNVIKPPILRSRLIVEYREIGRDSMAQYTLRGTNHYVWCQKGGHLIRQTNLW